MIPIRIPINDIPKFRQAKLGTLWVSSRGQVARLRRITNGRTLEGTLYLITLSRSKAIFKTNPDEWNPQ
jgi:hypothetical protein